MLYKKHITYVLKLTHIITYFHIAEAPCPGAAAIRKTPWLSKRFSVIAIVTCPQIATAYF